MRTWRPFRAATGRKPGATRAPDAHAPRCSRRTAYAVRRATDVEAVVPVPDDVMAEKVGAVIVPGAGARLDIDAILAYCGERLAHFKVPQYVVVRDDPLLRNANGELLKRDLEARTTVVAARRLNAG
jgi:acyl-CoA synthetase (AMP-forming)/AMP-acid ligase II